MNRFILSIVCMFFSLSLMAQNPQWGNRNGKGGGRKEFSPEEFCRRRDEFITSQCQLTKEEMSKISPIVNEMFGKLHEINAKRRMAAMSVFDGNKSESDFKKILEQMTGYEIEGKEVEKSCYFKIAKTIGYGKAIRVNHAIDMFRVVALRDFSPNGGPNNKNKNK